MKKFFLFLVLVGLFGYFVWPTQYREFAAGNGPYADQLGSVAYRVDRISGKVYVADATGKWTHRAVNRPELLRPDITGPTPNTQPDTQPAQRTMQEQQKMQSTTEDMTRAATQQTTPTGR
jgi:hypothetical protein